MKPGRFRYVVARDVEHALAVLAEHGDETSILAGGQSLVPLMSLRLARPEVVLDINRVADLSEMSVGPDGARIGALVRAATVERDEAIAAYVPVLASAIAHVGHPQIRNRTTIGGNVAHADPSSELPGVLACLEGSVTLRSAARGSREVGWDEFFESVFVTAKQPDELVTAVRFPMEPGWTYAYDEFAVRHGDFPIAGVCVGVHATDGIVRRARVSVVGVSDRPVRLTTVEDAARDAAFDADLASAMGAQAREACPANDDVHVSAEHRRWLVGTLVSRIVTGMAEAA